MTTSKAKTSQQKEYADKQKKLGELRKLADSAASEAAKQWLAKNPGYEDLAVRPLNISYVRNKQGITKAIIEIADRMVSPGHANKTQGEIVNDVQVLYPDINLHPNIWNKVLRSNLMERVHMRVKDKLPKPINLKGCNTLSKIRKKIKVSKDADAGKPYTFKPTIQISGEAVVINDTSYPLVMREVKGKKYPCIRVPVKGTRCWVRMDAVVATLKKV